MKKILTLSAVLVLGSLGLACGSAANTNVVNTTNSSNGNRTTNIASNANMMAMNANQMAMNANMKAENGNMMMNDNRMMNGNRAMNANAMNANR